jgi:hypothetical protein
MKAVIIVNGAPRVGKDTVVAQLAYAFRVLGVQTMEFSSIAPVEGMLKGHISTINKTPEDRALLSEMKAALEKHSQYCTTRCANEALAFFGKHFASDCVVFLHIREPWAIMELRKMLQKSDVRVRVETVQVIGRRAELVTSNASDQGTAGMVYDSVFENNGTLDDLKIKAKDWVASFMAR